ncbi:endonuclease/exonuclease/phosphatase family protein [Granulicoccus phenolivorans]|uniref:endonuclease/exonuclease/phosphatase family protein n=1 Tax=Granulicoccus phenolivorans TaxID=266854 RepID=UPI000428248C|nr:endonuclease/exonuclease/phosphatase family protein [Granulicoccus phenolivorans]
MKILTSVALAAAALTLTATQLPAAQAAPPATPEIRFATYNASLNRNNAGDLVRDLATPNNAQAAAVAETIQRNRPDVVLLNEFDYVADGSAVDLFRTNYLQVAHNGAAAIDYPYAYTAPVNTGVPTGYDLNRNGSTTDADDAYGFGFFPGQYGMVVLSKYPIAADQVRTFQNFLWRDMPGARLPDDPATPAPADWYSPEILAHFRLSSKSHWDVPVRIGRDTVHVLASHPTPPSFDGPEQRNKLRNADEIRFWADYITPGQGRYIYDDRGGRGGLNPSQSFVIMGDQNSDPHDGDSAPGAIQQLLDNKRLVDPLPTSAGGPEAAALQGGANATQLSDPTYDTADFADTPRPGNLRADYVLPSRKGLQASGAGVFWPTKADPLSRLTGEYPFPASDHRLVWVDLRLS